MNASRLIRLLLDTQTIAYEVMASGGVVSRAPLARQQARCALLKGDGLKGDGRNSEPELLLALYPATHRINLTALESIKRHRLRFLNHDEMALLLRQHTRSASQTNPIATGLQIIIDAELSNADTICFEDTEHGQLFRINAEDLLLLSDDALVGSAFSSPRQLGMDDDENDTPRLDLRERIRRIDTLPALPDMAHRLLIMRNDPHATLDALARVVEQDAALTAQIMRYANSALFGQKGQVATIEDAIFRVLGFDNVLNLALGVATARSFHLPLEGPLGLRRQWQHAVHSATLAQHLAGRVRRHNDHPQPGIAYLAGMLHDIGFLAMGQLFAPEYFWLGKLLSARKDVPVIRMERQLLGTGHTELGRVLMQGWHMPEPVIVAVAEHHNEAYDGEFAVYPCLVQLSERLLAREEFSDAAGDDLPPRLLSQLGLSEEDALAALALLHDDRELLDAMVSQLVA